MYGLQSENPGQLQKLDNWLRTTYKLVLQVCPPSYLTVHPQVLFQGVVTQTIGHGTAQFTPDPKAIPRRGPTTTETTTDPAREMEVDRSAYLTAPHPTDLTLLRHQNVSTATRRVTLGGFHAGATVFINVTEYSRPIKKLEDATCRLPSAKVTCRDNMGEMQNRLTTLDWQNQLLCHGVPWRLVVSVEETIAEEESVVLRCPSATWRACMSVVSFLQLLKLGCRYPQWLLSFRSRRVRCRC